jgi:hypothetical protein
LRRVEAVEQLVGDADDGGAGRAGCVGVHELMIQSCCRWDRSFTSSAASRYRHPAPTAAKFRQTPPAKKSAATGQDFSDNSWQMALE